MEDKEYYVFETTDKEGNPIEMAVIDEFEFEHKYYCAAALVEGDTIRQDGLFLYRMEGEGDSLTFRKITNAIDYQKVAESYMEMED